MPNLAARYQKVTSMRLITLTLIVFLTATSANAQWQIASEFDNRQSLPTALPQVGTEVKIGSELPNNQKFRWLVAALVIPKTIEGQSTSEKTIGLQFNAADGGEIYVAGQLEGRYDNDHPLLAVIADQSRP